MSFRLLEVSICEKSVCEAQLSVRVIRLESKNCPKLADVFVIFTHCREESCVAVVRIRRVWFQTCAGFKVKRGILVVPDPL